MQKIRRCQRPPQRQAKQNEVGSIYLNICRPSRMPKLFPSTGHSVAFKDAMRDMEAEEETDWVTDLTLLTNEGQRTDGGSRKDGGAGGTSDPEYGRSTSEHQTQQSKSYRDEIPFLSNWSFSQSIASSIINFFEPRFADPEMEALYQREV